VNTPSSLECLIERCNDCPFCEPDPIDSDDPRCKAKTRVGRKLPGEQAPHLRPPSWCVLRSGQVVLRLVK
jgi:hypothetical protein